MTFVPATTRTRPSGRGAAPAPLRVISSEPVGENEPEPLAAAGWGTSSMPASAATDR